jgi:imidazolonepropionase-like amidohydrolase
VQHPLRSARAGLATVFGFALLLASTATASAQTAAVEPGTVFQNVRVFDGRRGVLSGPTQVVVRGNRIERIDAGPIAPDASLTRIEGGGRTLMPGLIDAHWHTMLVALPPTAAIEGDIGYFNLVAAAQAKATLLRGFTSVRDLGGPCFGLKQAIDEGVSEGPRIYPSGAIISVTGGHGDFRSTSELPRILGGPLSRMTQIGGSSIADSPDEVRVRVREQLMLGASQIKLTAGGGVASPHSPLDVSTFTLEELRAAVEAADNWGTYVGVHAYTPVAIQRALEAGVKVIDHGHLADEASAKQMKAKGAWWSLQAFLDDEFVPPLDAASRAKLLEVVKGTENAYRLAKKYAIKTAWGTDILFSPAIAATQGAQLARMTRWYTPSEVLVMATSTNAELLALSGERNPYPGKLGVVEVGALADLLLVDGDPLANIELVANPQQNFVVIMKDGKLYKNTLAAR